MKADTYQSCCESVTACVPVNSEEMIVSLTPEKQLAIQNGCLSVLHVKRPSIRYVCHVIGLLIAAFPGVMYGSLKHNRGDFDKTMSLSLAACEELTWWERNVNTAYSTLTHDDPSMFIDTDSSSLGWGAFNKSLGLKTGGEWLPSEWSKHINYLELKAVLFALKSFCSHVQNTHVSFQIDNVTAVAYIREMGGQKVKIVT